MSTIKKMLNRYFVYLLIVLRDYTSTLKLRLKRLLFKATHLFQRLCHSTKTYSKLFLKKKCPIFLIQTHHTTWISTFTYRGVEDGS